MVGSLASRPGLPATCARIAVRCAGALAPHAQHTWRGRSHEILLRLIICVGAAIGEGRDERFCAHADGTLGRAPGLCPHDERIVASLVAAVPTAQARSQIIVRKIFKADRTGSQAAVEGPAGRRCPSACTRRPRHRVHSIGPRRRWVRPRARSIARCVHGETMHHGLHAGVRHLRQCRQITAVRIWHNTFAEAFPQAARALARASAEIGGVSHHAPQLPRSTLGIWCESWVFDPRTFVTFRHVCGLMYVVGVCSARWLPCETVCMFAFRVDSWGSFTRASAARSNEQIRSALLSFLLLLHLSLLVSFLFASWIQPLASPPSVAKGSPRNAR